MKLNFLTVGQKHDPLFTGAIQQYTGKIGHYFKCEWTLIAPAKISASATAEQVLLAELPLIEKAVSGIDFLVLLDERGQMLSSPGLADLVQQAANRGTRQLGFLIGGAYGVHSEIRRRAQFVWQLSELVFPHQLVRVLLSEQVYRACSILSNEKYHHA